jgi:DNA/RNA endonuclease G (NUC1)
MKKLLLFLLVAVSQFSIGQVVVLKHTAYEIHFDTKLKQPLYTHYVLTKEHAKQCIGSKFERTAFHQDSLLCSTCQASNKNYDGYSKIYDRGHLAPDDDFRWSKRTEREAMIYDNQSFQVFQFNRGTWKSLEVYVRSIAKQYDVDITTGAIYGTTLINGLLVPDYYWKIIKYNGKVEAWKIPNVKPKEGDSFQNYKTDANELIKLIN